MIRVILKHWIYETCIDVLFDSILGNFLSVLKDDHIIPDDIMQVYEQGMREIPSSRNINQLKHSIVAHRTYCRYTNTELTQVQLADLNYLARNVMLDISLTVKINYDSSSSSRGHSRFSSPGTIV
jgi:acyl carrier protein phosphodiesterase